MGDITGRGNIVTQPHGPGEPGPLAMSILAHTLIPHIDPTEFGHDVWSPRVDMLEPGDVAMAMCGYMFRIRGTDSVAAGFPGCPLCIAIGGLLGQLRRDLLIPPHRNPYGWNPEGWYDDAE